MELTKCGVSINIVGKWYYLESDFLARADIRGMVRMEKTST